MQIRHVQSRVTETDADAVVVGAFEDAPLAGAAAEIDLALGGAVRGLVERREFTGRSHELLPLLVPVGRASQALMVGLGRRDTFNAGAAFRAAATAARHLAAKQRADVAFFLDDNWQVEWTESAVCGAIVGCQGQDLYRAEKNRHPFGTLAWSGRAEQAVTTGRILGESVNLTRRLVNEPADEIYPETFAARTAEIAGQNGLEVEIWNPKRLEVERCGALLAVAKGSSRPARLVMLRYHGAGKDSPTLAIVGKGVTFDSGGLSLKTPEGMLTMKCDKAGASTMVGALAAIAQLELPVNVIGIAGLVENMTGPAAMKLGDVLVARNGRTIEVHNTDAEGRLVLADLLSLAVDLGVSKIVDLATLTGACVVALGTEVAGVMANHQPWCDAVVSAARRVGEPIWQLPMYPEIFDELIKSEVADIKNVGDGRWGGAITAAKFLEQFVGNTPWAHIDIAGPAFRDKAKPWCDAGASGQFVRTLVQIAREWNA
ncbi:MAG TPA: leucyl aminopeptidase [Pirellulales bacterium]|nr:leucyl aminopeptidase [Pirellulales bacterium]